MHTYREGAQGRSLQANSLDGVRYARLQCSICRYIGRVHVKNLMPPEQLDHKFQQQGWDLDPHICPACISKRRSAHRMKKIILSHGSTVALVAPLEAEPEPAPTTELSKQRAPEPMPVSLVENETLRAASINAHKAAARMHQLIAVHFTVEEGRYATGWSDERIATETGLAATHVGEVREIAYGALKLPDAIADARNDLKTLGDLFIEMMTAADKAHDEAMDKIKQDMNKEMAAIRVRLTDAAKALGLKL